MLRRIDIHGFKGVIRAELELGRITMIEGSNDTGKTTLLDAMAVLGGAAGGRVDPVMLAYRGLRHGSWPRYRTALRSEGSEQRPIRLRVWSEGASYSATLDAPGKECQQDQWTFAEETLEEGSVVVASRGPSEHTVALRHGKNIPLPPLEAQQGIVPSFKGIRGGGAATDLVKALESFTIFTPVAQVISGILQDPSALRPVGPWGGRLAEAIYRSRPGDMTPPLRGRLNEELRRAAGTLSAMSIEPPSAPPAEESDAEESDDERPSRPLLFSDSRMRPDAGWLPASEVSDGAKYLTALLALLSHRSTPPILGIDNVDGDFSPKIACYLLRRMQEIVLEDPGRPQILLTSRNLYARDALDLTDDRVRLYSASRNALTGAVELKRVTHIHIEEGSPGPDMERSRL